jgi:DNA uptake protein ComE-like DNA-binding protein
MKQEYHYTIARSDRIWLIAFVLFLLAWELVKYALPSAAITENLNNRVDTTDSTSIIPINENNNKYSSAKKSHQENDTYANDSFEQDEPITPFPIQEATFKDLKSAGLSTYVANNILKYISAGGKVKNANDLMKIYGMDSVQLITSSPYLIYPTAENIPFADSSKNSYSPKRFTKTLDLNQATIHQLDSLPGIGPVLAERIIKFKEGLGGFFDIHQLKDIYGLPPETLEKITPYLTITTTPELININEQDLTNFSHPYLHKRFPKMIKAYRDHHGPFMDASDLRKVYPPDSTWCEKILPYLIFN